MPVALSVLPWCFPVRPQTSWAATSQGPVPPLILEEEGAALFPSSFNTR